MHQQSWVWDEQRTRRFFLAGGETEADFEIYWQQVLQENQQCEQALLNHSFYASGGTMLYLISGRKADSEPEKTKGGQ